ncbi:MAG: hypothetical protein IJI66_15085 [Erysipelotrichaceae bacterium]|nr:hypothetical protein [Erysipelotrichaceae bacterium]
MRKITTVIIVLLFLSACSSEKESSVYNGSNTSSVSDVISQQIKEYKGETEDKEPDNDQEEKDKSVNDFLESEQADLDLSYYSANVMFGKINEMTQDYQDYVGKIIKMKGEYYRFDNPRDNTYFYVCIVKDQTACCSSGLEFILKKGYEYPEQGDQILLQGVFSTYNEGKQVFIRLEDCQYSLAE